MNISARASWVILAIAGPVWLLGTTYLVLVYLDSHERGLGFNTAAAKVNWAQLCYAGAAMALGLLFSFIHRRAAAAGDGAFNIGQTLEDIPRTAPFWRAFAVSPMVFGFVLVGVGDSELTITQYLLAFQNGFFWETVFGGVAGTRTPTTTTAMPVSEPNAGEEAGDETAGK
ncbi:hypothetical protein [Nocardia goodfellowii]|uniref:Uncharacterized protein n=1 Tax=Nocardia goodfellowii TaxID=882446 RepID=A0ABS4QPU1_9NOCA|nr:hypothetical protein [Nocardia goodfellowii]MBP2193044.1 hypothetical protein [Nocardia goodfellowii]